MKLVKIDLSKAKGHECSGIKVGNGFHYLAVLDNGNMAVGSFSRQWYGLNFTGFYGAGL